MVGFGSTLRLSKRRGWEKAYVDYENLKLLLTQIEAGYEETISSSIRTTDGFLYSGGGGGGGGGMEPEDLPLEEDPFSLWALTDGSENRGGDLPAKYKSTDYRDELFFASDSSDAFYSSSEEEEGGKDVAVFDSDYTGSTPHMSQPHPHEEGEGMILHGAEFSFSYDAPNHGSFGSGHSDSNFDELHPILERQSQPDILGFGSIPPNTQSSFTRRANQRRSSHTTPKTQNYSSSELLDQHGQTQQNQHRRQRHRDETKKRRKRRKRQRKVPRHLRVAHEKARAITGRFLGLMGAEVDKVMLFAHARMGELSDTIGNLRFPFYEEDDSASFHGWTTTRNHDYPLSNGGGMHSSDSSSDDDVSLSWSSEDENEIVERRKSMMNSHPYNHSRRRRRGRRINSGSRDDRPRKSRSEDSEDTLNSRGYADFLASDPNKVLQHSEDLRVKRPIFQRSDYVVGEDFSLLSAVDEADAFTAVGVEMLHLLKYICVNVIAIRKLCLKHDKLLSSRMLGGYYHKLDKHQKSALIDSRNSTMEFTPKRSNASLRRGPIALSRQRRVASEQPLRGMLWDAVRKTEGKKPTLFKNKLNGVYDSMVQNLASCTAFRSLSDSLSLALTEFEVSHRRADALSKLNTKKRSFVVSNESPSASFDLCLNFPKPKIFGLSQGRNDPAFSARDHSYDDDSVEGGPSSTASYVSLTRLRFVVASVLDLKEASKGRCEPPINFYLSRSKLVLKDETSFVGEVQGLDGCSKDTLRFFVAYNPDSILLTDLNVLQKTLVKKKKTSLFSAVGLSTVSSTREVISPVDDDTSHPEVMNDLIQQRKRAIQRQAIFLLKFSSVLSTMNYYIVMPSASSFCTSLGGRHAHSFILIGALNMTSFLMFVLQTTKPSYCWAEKNSIGLNDPITSHHRLLLFCAAFGIIGNFAYSIAYHYGSIPLAILGRLLAGFSCSDLVNKRLLVTLVSSDALISETARLQTMCFYGVALATLFASVFYFLEYSFAVGNFNFTLHFFTLPGYIMSILWFMQVIFLLFTPFALLQTTEGPTQGNDSLSICDSIALSKHDDTRDFQYRRTPSMLLDKCALDRQTSDFSFPEESMDGCSKSSVSPQKAKSHRRISSIIRRAQNLVFSNVALPITIAIVIFVSGTMEMIFASCAVLLHRYFAWSGAYAGFFLTFLGLSYFPLYLGSSYWSRRRDERTVIKKSLSNLMIGLLIMINYEALINLFIHIQDIFEEIPISSDFTTYYTWGIGKAQYLIGTAVMFFSCVTIEGSALSLMSKVSPKRLNRLPINCSTIAPMATCLGRLFGDVALFIMAYSRRNFNTDMINSISFFVFCTCFACYYVVRRHYFFLN